MKTPIGQMALHLSLDLQVPPPAVRSYAMAGNRRTEQDGQRTIEYYPQSYLKDTSSVGHLRFALRYEPLDLGVLYATFSTMDPAEIEAWVRREPSGAYSRRTWFFYEFLMGRELDLKPVQAGNYVEALDPHKHIVGGRRNSTRHRVIDNLLGVPGLCPTVRRTSALQEYRGSELASEARQLTESYEPAVLARAVSYLYTKETRSSFQLEGETPGMSRTEKFVAALRDAGRFDPCDKGALVALQNAIVDKRYAAIDYRSEQTFVGSIASGYRDHVDFVCPKPEDVGALMCAWMGMTDRLLMDSVDAVIAAALASFIFVFIHPFSDGNGRIHRFLLHHILARRKFSPPGMIFPISAAILRDRHRYDEALESFSLPMLPFIEWKFNERSEMLVENETGALYQYFDATSVVEFLYGCVRDTVQRDLREELGFMAVYERAMNAVKDVVDMPDRRASLIVRMIFQNGGRLSSNKRSQFDELSDEEVRQIETVIAVARQTDEGKV
jgi:hypothetical protein